MKIFIIMFFCIATTQVVLTADSTASSSPGSSNPPASSDSGTSSPPASITPSPQPLINKEGASESTDDQVKDAKAKATAALSVGIGKGKDAASRAGDQKAIINLDGLSAKILKAIQESGATRT